MRYDLVIFDLDGTILNTIDDLADSCNHVLESHGMPLRSVAEIMSFVGNGIPKLIERAVPAGTSRSDYEEVLADYKAYYGTHCSIKTAPYPGMMECLKRLKACGIKLAVNTNKLEDASIELCDRHFPGVFHVVAGNVSGVPPKPAPDGVLHILKILYGVESLQEVSQTRLKACYVGDSDVDVATGRNCGFDVIGAEWGFRGRRFLLDHGASLVAGSPQELESLLLS